MDIRRLLILNVAVVLGGIFTDAMESSSNCTFKIISREEWGAEPPKLPPIKMKIFPPFYVIITQTLTQHCWNQNECFKLLRGIQYMHMKQFGWNDIADNFLVGGDGNVYEGRGWDIEGAHTKNYNYKSISVAFIGNYSKTKPTQQQLDATQKLLEYGMKKYKLTENYKLLAHRQVSYTLNPGDQVYAIIKTWKHWVYDP